MKDILDDATTVDAVVQFSSDPDIIDDEYVITIKSTEIPPPPPPTWLDLLIEWWNNLSWWRKALILGGSATSIGAVTLVAKKK